MPVIGSAPATTLETIRSTGNSAAVTLRLTQARDVGPGLSQGDRSTASAFLHGNGLAVAVHIVGQPWLPISDPMHLKVRMPRSTCSGCLPH